MFKGNHQICLKTATLLLLFLWGSGFLFVAKLHVSPVSAAVIDATTEPPTETATSTFTPEPTATPSPLPILTDTSTAEPTPTETATSAPSDTPVATPTETLITPAVPTDTPSPISTPMLPTETATATTEPAVPSTPTTTDTPLPAKSSVNAMAVPGDVVINEVAWSGTAANFRHEWLELFNTTPLTITLAGWVITSTNGINLPLSGAISPNSYYLIERAINGVITDVTAELTSTFKLLDNNNGDALFLSTGGVVIDSANGDGGNWLYGSASPTYKSMERQSAFLPDTDTNWKTNDPTIARNGRDANNNPINGTPKQLNSAAYVLPTPTPTPPPVPGSVIINEVAWGGTTASSSDEWIELLNVTTQTITFTNWAITNTNMSIALTGVISPNGYYLIERTDDTVIKDITATLTASFGSGLTNSGGSLFLSAGGVVIDTANADGGSWPAGISSETGRYSMERINASIPETDTTWATNKGCRINGHDADNNPIFGTPGMANDGALPPLPASPLLISEFLYDGPEFVEICNPGPAAITNLSCYKVGDEEISGEGESMYHFPGAAILAPNSCLVVAKNATEFQARFNRLPDYDLTSNNNITDLIKYPVWANGTLSLANDGDELLVLGPNNEILDSAAYRNGDYTTLGLEPDASAPEPHSLQRVWPTDTNSMPHDFVRTDPNPGIATTPPLPPASPPPPASLPAGMYAYWGDLHAHTTYSDGAGPPHYALAMARAAGLHFQAITDHDWWLTPVEWAKIFTQTTAATAPGQFVALRGVEWTHDSVGHINVFNTDTLLNSRTAPMFSSLPDFYSWLGANPDVIAQFNHPDPSYGGTFYNFAYHPAAAQVMFMQEIGNKAQKYTTYEPSFVQSNIAGWQVAPTNNSDVHSAKWGSHTAARTGLVAPALTENDLLAAMRARRVFATEDSNLAIALRINGAWMGSTLTVTGPMSLTVDMVDPDPEPLTLYLYDGNLSLATVPLAISTGQWSTTIRARAGHFFWVKVVQADGNAAYTAPIWIEGQAAPAPLVINEILPAPHDWDWDGDGTADYRDEWVEVFNPTKQPIGLGGWQLMDSSGAAYNIPLGGVIPAGGFAIFYQAQTQFSLNNDEETVSLVHPNGTVVDSFSYHHSPGYDESYCRLPDAGTVWSDNCGPSPQAANWEKAPAGPLTVKIFEAKRLTPNAWVRVKGRVTAPPGVFGARNMYIQDNSSGILIYLPKDHRLYLSPGDRVEVVGNLRIFHEEFEIAVKQRGEVKLLEHGAPLPPLPIATTSLLEPYEGMLVMLQGQAVDFKGRTTLWLDDGTGWAKAYIRKTTGIKKPFINRGDPVTIVGIVSQFSEEDNPSRNDYRLLPRYQTDLIVASLASATPTPPATWPTLLPDTGY